MSGDQFTIRKHRKHYSVHAPTQLGTFGRTIAVVEDFEEAKRIRKEAAATARRVAAEEQRK